MTKTIKQRLGELESVHGHLPLMVFEQAWDSEGMFYLAHDPDNPNAPRPKQGALSKKDLMTKAQAEAMAGDKYRPLFITYVKDWRGVDNA